MCPIHTTIGGREDPRDLADFTRPLAALLLDGDGLGLPVCSFLARLGRPPSSVTLGILTASDFTTLKTELLPLLPSDVRCCLYAHRGRARLALGQPNGPDQHLEELYRRQHGLHPYDVRGLEDAALEAAAYYWMEYGRPDRQALFQNFQFQRPVVRILDHSSLILAPVPGPDHHPSLDVRLRVAEKLSEILSRTRLDRFYETFADAPDQVVVARTNAGPAAAARDLLQISTSETGKPGKLLLFTTGHSGSSLPAILPLPNVVAVLASPWPHRGSHPSVWPKAVSPEDLAKLVLEKVEKCPVSGVR
ncbi:MAG: hypothetical protein HYU36_07000 [Planctomycetes bacterium]|nr:hypothetical protein [Planctomycetota bacterium]